MRSEAVFFCTAILSAFAVYSHSAQYPLPEMDPEGYPSPKTACLAPGKCHAGIEPIRSHNSGMMRQIYTKGKAMGDPNGCVVCHGGNPKEEKDAAMAHKGAPKRVGSAYHAIKIFHRGSFPGST